MLAVASIPIVALWALLDQPGSPVTARAGAAGVAARVPASVAGIHQVLHVAVPGTHSTRVVNVYRPPVPDSANLPVLYLLHGSPGSASDPAHAGIPALIDHLLADGYPPFVLAVPDGNGSKRRDTEWANAVDGSDQFETFVTQGVVNAVEGSNRRDRTRRAIAGFSMGGYGAVNLALHHPDLYGQVVPIAGYFHVDDTSGVFGHQLEAIDANTPELHLADARGQRMLVVDGDQGRDRVVSGESRLFYQQLLAARIPASYEQLVGDHSWKFVAAAFPDVVRFLDAEWSALQPPVPAVVSAAPSATARWQGALSGAHVQVDLLGSHDPRTAPFERLRDALHAAPVSYVALTLSNPAGAAKPVALFRASLVDRGGTTIDANPARPVLQEWLDQSVRQFRRGPPAPPTIGSRSPSSRVISEVQQVERTLPAEADVPPGRSATVLLVTTGVVRHVSMVFVGDSYAEGTLERTS